jgi:two-component system, NtrC family, sensor kinase
LQKISNENLILKVIKYLPVIFILICSLLSTLYISYNYTKTLEKEKEEIKKNYIEFNKSLIQNNIDIIDKYINNKNKEANNLLKEKIKEHIDLGHEVMTSIYNKYKNTKTKEEIIAIIKTALENIRFDKGRGYFSVYTIEGINIFQPLNKIFEGTSLFNRQDAQGNYPVQEAISIVNTKSEGFFSWDYYKPNDRSKEFGKIGIVKKFEPYNLIISTSEYVDDFEKQVKRETLEYVKNLEYQNNEYIFVIDKNENFLLTKTRFEKVSDIDEKYLFIEAFKDFKNSEKENIFLEYKFENYKKEYTTKTSYLKKIKVYDWIIGTGFNLDDLNLQIKEKQKKLQEDYDEKKYLIFIISITITFMFLIISTFISRKLEKKFLDYKENLEKQIIENKNQKETLLKAQEVAHIGDWKLDLKTNKSFWSDEIIRIFGVDKSDKDKFGPEYLKNIMIPEDVVLFKNLINNCINTGTEHKCIYRIKRADNKIVWIESRGKLDDDKLFIIGTIQDISENKILEIEKQKKEELLYQQSKLAAMGEMIGNIAHQWRQPLSVISTASTGAKLQKEMNCLSDEEFYSVLTSINTSAQYLSSTIDDFRNFFNPSNNKVNEFNIAETFRKTLNLLKAQFVAKDIEIIQNIEECQILSIENELIQVLINILNNARDALILKENKKRLIFINAYLKENVLCIEIKDNAGGIEEDIIDRIFEPYFTTKHKSQGTGIGLFMSKEIIENHLEGKLFVSNEEFIFESIDYLGAKFSIEIVNMESKD